ncbi:MAG TPA: hypothetical protein VIL72_02860 [Beijerinckiaceae bacterium]|jgi:hypothetical protein
MFNIDWLKDLYVLIGLSAGACLFAGFYAALETVVPFLRGGFARMN